VGSAMDGNTSLRTLTSEMASITTEIALTDGIKGLDMGTAISNIPTSVIITIPVGNFSIAAVNGATPDLFIVNIGTPSLSDTYEFLDINNNVLDSIAVNFNSALFPALATGSLELYEYTSGQSIATALPTTSGQSGGRDIKAAAYRLTTMGIT